jgi:hypothetical protein
MYIDEEGYLCKNVIDKSTYIPSTTPWVFWGTVKRRITKYKVNKDWLFEEVILDL